MRRAHRAGILLVALCGLGMWAVPRADAQDAAPNISVSFTASPAQPGCLSAAEAGSAQVTDAVTEVVMTITARFDICGDVTAAIYAMPNNRDNPWPQTKVEAETFRIKAGVTTVRFAKGCTPQQFDLVTGQTPQTIRPDTGPMHGPMLYEIPWTGVPFWGTGCQPTTTTTSTTLPGATTTTLPGATSTTVPTSVGGVTTTITSTTVKIAGVTQTNPGGGTTTGSGTALAATGVPADLAGAWGAVLLTAGLLLLAGQRALALTAPERRTA